MLKIGDSFDGAVLKAHNPIPKEYDYWTVACVCKRPVNVPTPKLEKWFHNGKPVGCSACRVKEKLYPPKDQGTEFTSHWQRKAPGKYQRIALPVLQLSGVTAGNLSEDPLPRSDDYRLVGEAKQNAPTPPPPATPPTSPAPSVVLLDPKYQFKI